MNIPIRPLPVYVLQAAGLEGIGSASRGVSDRSAVRQIWAPVMQGSAHKTGAHGAENQTPNFCDPE